MHTYSTYSVPSLVYRGMHIRSKYVYKYVCVNYQLPTTRQLAYAGHISAINIAALRPTFAKRNKVNAWFRGIVEDIAKYNCINTLFIYSAWDTRMNLNLKCLILVYYFQVKCWYMISYIKFMDSRYSRFITILLYLLIVVA